MRHIGAAPAIGSSRNPCNLSQLDGESWARSPSVQKNPTLCRNEPFEFVPIISVSETA
jgi:hypothetical protein